MADIKDFNNQDFEKVFYNIGTKAQDYNSPNPEFVGNAIGKSKFDSNIPFESIDNIDRIRAERQPWYEQSGAMLNQAVVGEIIGGTLMSVGALLEAPEMVYNEFMNKDNEFHNTVFDIGKGMSDWSQEATPIYDTGERFNDPGYWFKNGVSVASSLSMLIPGMGIAKGAQLIGKGAGKGLTKLIGREIALGTTASGLLQTGMGALAMRHAENYREASGVYDSIYQQGMQAFSEGKLPNIKSEEDVKKAASQAAALDYNANYINLAFDMIQLGSILKPLGSFTRNVGLLDYKLAKATGKLPTSKLGKAAYWMAEPGKGLLEQSTEGIEEVINTISQFEGEREGKIKLGLTPDDGSALSDRIGGYLGKEETMDSFIWGVLGGVAFNALGKPVSKVLGLQQDNTTERKLSEIANRENTIKQYSQHVNAINTGEVVRDIDGSILADYSQTTDEDKTTLVNDLRGKMAFKLGLDASKAGNVDLLLEQFDDKDFQNTLTGTGLASKETLAQDIKAVKDEVVRAEETYKKHYQRLFEKPIDQNIKNRLLDKAVILDNRRYDALESIKQLESDYNNLYQKDGFIQSNPDKASIDLTIYKEGLAVALMDLNEHLQEAKKTGNTYAEEKINRVISNIEKKLKTIGNKTPIDPSYIDRRLGQNIAQQEIHKEWVNIYSEDLSNIDKKQSIEKASNEIKDAKNVIKDALSKSQRDNEELAKEERLIKQEEQISSLEANLQSQYDNKKTYAESTFLKDTNLSFFSKELDSMSDDYFLDNYDSIINSINETIDNAKNYLSDTSISSDEKASLGEILKREHDKLMIAKDKFANIDIKINDPIQLEAESDTTKQNKKKLIHDIKQEELNETLINEIVDDISEDGKIMIIRGKKYFNLYSFTESKTGIPGAINRNSSGDIISVTLQNESGNNVTFKDKKIVDAVAYMILMKEMSVYESKVDSDGLSGATTEIIENKDSYKKEVDKLRLTNDLAEIDETISFIDASMKQVKFEYKSIGYKVSDATNDPSYINLSNQLKELEEIKKIVINKLTKLNNSSNEQEQIKSIKRVDNKKNTAKASRENTQGAKQNYVKDTRELQKGLIGSSEINTEESVEIASSYEGFDSNETLYPVEVVLVDDFSIDLEMQELQKQSKSKETPIEPEIKIATEVNPEARQLLNQLGYKDSQIDELSVDDRKNILTKGIPKEEWDVLSKYKQELKNDDDTKIIPDDNYYDNAKAKVVSSELDNIVEDLKNSNGAKSVDSDGSIVYENSKIESGHNALGHQDRAYKREEVAVAGVKSVRYTDEDNALNEDAPLDLLNPDKYKVGEQVEFVVDDTDDIKIYDPSKEGKEVITWGAYKKLLQDKNPGVDVTKLQDYKNNIPIRVSGINAYLHSDNWITEENVTGNIQDDKLALRKIRNGIVEKGHYKTDITNVSNGVLFLLANDESHSLKEAVGNDSEYTFAVGTNDGLKVGEGRLFEQPVINKKIISGASYIIVKTPAGNNIAISTNSQRIGDSANSEDIKKLIVRAINTFLDNDIASSKDILRITGFDVTDLNGPENFLKAYLHLYNTNGKMLGEIIKSIPNKTTNMYFSVNKGVIEFFDGDLSRGGGKVYFMSKENQSQREMFLSKLEKSLDGFYLNSNIDYFDRNKNIPIFDGDNLVAKPYREFIMENLKTRVKGNKVGEKNGKDVYSYSLQPVYRFNFKEFLAEEGVESKVKSGTASVIDKIDEVKKSDIQGLSEDTSSLLDSLDNWTDLPWVPNISQSVSFNKEANNSHLKC